MSGRNAVGTLLVVVGALAVLNFLGVNFGNILGFLFPFILVALGILGWANGKKWIGGTLIVIGSIMLLGGLGKILLLLLAIGLIAGGLSMFRGNGRKYYR